MISRSFVCRHGETFSFLGWFLETLMYANPLIAGESFDDDELQRQIERQFYARCTMCAFGNNWVLYEEIH